MKILTEDHVVYSIHNVYVGILSFCWFLIADETCYLSFVLPLILIGTMPLCLIGILSVDLTIPVVAFCSQFQVYVRNLPSFWIQQFFSLSQAYDSKNFFWTSVPKIISVSGNLSQMMKLCVNLNSAILWWSAVIGNPSAVFNVVEVGSMGVLKLSSMSWYVVYILSDTASPESMRALYCFLAWTVIVGQSVMSATVIGSCVVSPPCSWSHYFMRVHLV